MPLTRAASDKIFNKIVDELLDVMENGPVRRAFKRESISTLEDLIGLDERTIAGLVYAPEDEPDELGPFPKVYRRGSLCSSSGTSV